MNNGHVASRKTDGSWWRVLTKCGPLEKGMVNHFSILALRTPCENESESHSVMSDSLQPHGLVHGILQARILKWVVFPFSRGPSQPRDQTQVSCIAGRFFTGWATRGAQENKVSHLTLQVPMQYCCLQYWTLLPSPVTSTAGHYFHFGLCLHSFWSCFSTLLQ